MPVPLDAADRDFIANAIRNGDRFKLITALQLLIAEGADLNTAISGSLEARPLGPPDEIATITLNIIRSLADAMGVPGDLRLIADNMPHLGHLLAAVRRGRLGQEK